MNNRTMPLGELVTEIKEIVFPNSKEAIERPYLGLEQIESNTGAILSQCSNNIEGKSNTYAFDERHVLYGKLRPYLNKVALPDYRGRCSTEIIPFLPNGINRDYLAFLFRTETVVNAAMTDKTGSRMPRADINKLLSLKVKIPENMNDQHRIATRLKTQLAEVEKAHKAMEVQFKDAVFLISRHREQALELLKEKKRVPLSEMLLGIEAGKSFKTNELPARLDELGVIKVSAVSWNKFQPQEAKAVEGGYQPDERHRIKNGDLIISRANTIELVGAVVRTSKDYPLRLLSDKTLRLVIDEDKVYPDYLLNILKWPEARSHIMRNATGTSDSMRNISQKTICSIPVPLITKNKQHVIINKFNAISEEALKIEAAMKKSLSDIAMLPQKLLAQAFEM